MESKGATEDETKETPKQERTLILGWNEKGPAIVKENGELKQVFEQLFSAEGSEIYLKPIEKYLAVGQETNFYTLVENAAQRGETAIGYKRESLAHDPASAFGVVVNPCKLERITFSKEDRLIVLAEN